MAAAAIGLGAAEAATTTPAAAQERVQEAERGAVTLEYLRDNPYRGTKAEAVTMFEGARHPAWFDAAMSAQARRIIEGPSNFDTALIQGVDPDTLDPNGERFDLMTQGPISTSGGRQALVNEGGRVNLDLRRGVVRTPARGEDTHLGTMLEAERWVVRNEADPSKVAIFTHLEICNNIAVQFLTLENVPTPETPRPQVECADIVIEGMPNRGFFVVGAVVPTDESASATIADVCWPDVEPSTLLCIGDACDPRRAAFDVIQRNRRQLGIRDVAGADIGMETYAAFVQGQNGSISVPMLDADKRGWVVICPVPTAEERRRGISYAPALVRWESLQDGTHTLSGRDWPQIRDRR